MKWVSIRVSQFSPSAIAPWLVAAYGVHLLDERLVGDGVAEWATRVAGMPFSNSEWLVVNMISFAVVASLAWAIRAERLGALMLLVVAGHLLMHGTQHLAGALRFGEFSPGIVTGLAICLPVSVLAISIGFRLLSRPRAVAAFVAGLFTFQPIWHQLFLLVSAGAGHAE